MRLTKEEALAKTQILLDNEVPVLFSLRWPPASASGHGLIVDVSPDEISVEGNSGSLTILLRDGFEYDLSGHYQLRDAQKSGLDLYFRKLKRVRALTFNDEHGEAHIIFEVGADKK